MLNFKKRLLAVANFVKLCYHFYNRCLWAFACECENETEMNL